MPHPLVRFQPLLNHDGCDESGSDAYSHDQGWLVSHILCEGCSGAEKYAAFQGHPADQHLLCVAPGHRNRGPGGEIQYLKGINGCLLHGVVLAFFLLV